MIYMDNGATSLPKPPQVAEAMCYYMTKIGVNVNRGVYGPAQEAELRVLSLRERLCRLFHFPDPSHAVLTPGMTFGMNQLLKGLLRPGDHCLVSAMEHNAVMRPLHQLRTQGVSFSRLPCDREGRLDPDAIEAHMTPSTRLLVMAHASNVAGTVQDARRVGEICAAHGVFFALDAAQTAGHYPIDFTALHLSALAAPGHKGLLGPAGTGILLLSAELAAALEPLVSGGTGSVSDSEIPPEFMPDRFEAGTPNLPGLFGLEAALAWIEAQTVARLHAHERALTARFLANIDGLDGLRLAGSKRLDERVGVISLDFLERDNAEVAFRLEQEYSILTRCGMHCAPAAHKALGTFPQGVVRFCPGAFTTGAEIDETCAAITAILRG